MILGTIAQSINIKHTGLSGRVLSNVSSYLLLPSIAALTSGLNAPNTRATAEPITTSVVLGMEDMMRSECSSKCMQWNRITGTAVHSICVCLFSMEQHAVMKNVPEATNPNSLFIQTPWHINAMQSQV